MTFRDYVASRRITDTPAGDFTADARRDKRLPEIASWDDLHGYLRGRLVHRDVVDAARAVWRGYVKARGEDNAQ